MAERAGHSRAIRLPALQHAGLQAMGVNVPWIAAEPSPETAQAALLQPVTESESPSPASGKRPSRLSATSPVTTSGTSSAQGIEQPERVGASDGNDPGIQTLGLDSLAQRIQACEACALCGNRRHSVVGQGVTHSSVDVATAGQTSETMPSVATSKPVLMVIGEAPGEQEDLQGEPFVGPSGELLDNMLAAIGCNRFENVYITNVVKCRPPGNRNPREVEIAACLPYLTRQIELVAPSVILALGRFAAQTLLESSDNLMNLRERDHQVKVHDTHIPLVVTYHPAYLLRKPVDKRLAWQDLKRVSALLKR